MKKYFAIFSVFVFLGMGVWTYAKSEKEIEDDNYKKVKIAKAEKAEFQNIFTSSGIVKGEDETDLAFEITGRIDSILKEEGEKIRKGEVLATTDNSSISAERDFAREQYNVSSNVSNETDDYYDQLIDEADSALEKAEESYDIAKENNDEDAEKIAEKSMEQAEEAVSSAKKMKKLQVEIANGETDVYGSQIKVYDQNIQKTKLFAPYDGVIIAKNFDVGSVVSGSNAVFTIARSAKKEVEIFVPLSVFEDVELGDYVRVISDNNENRVGKIKSKSPRPNGAEFKAELTIELDSESFEFGTFVNVKIGVGDKLNSVAIPLSSVKKEYYENVVFVIEDGVAKSKFVDLGIIQNNMVQIKSGISEGELVAIEGNQYLEDKDKIIYE